MLRLCNRDDVFCEGFGVEKKSPVDWRRPNRSPHEHHRVKGVAPGADHGASHIAVCQIQLPAGHHLELETRGGRLVTHVYPNDACDKYTPSVDRLFVSAAKHFGQDLLAVLLTGMGDDGRSGALGVKECGGSVIAESEETAVIFGMPQQAIRAGAVDLVLPLGEIPAAIQSAGDRVEGSERKLE